MWRRLRLRTLSYDGCLEVRGKVIRTVLCCIVYWSCAQSVISTLRRAVLTVLCIGFCLTGPISTCVDLSVLCVFILCFFHTAVMSYYCNTVRWILCDRSLIFRTMSSFSALTLSVGSFDMTFNVFGGTLNHTQLNTTRSVILYWVVKRDAVCVDRLVSSNRCHIVKLPPEKAIAALLILTIHFH